MAINTVRLTLTTSMSTRKFCDVCDSPVIDVETDSVRTHIYLHKTANSHHQVKLHLSFFGTNRYSSDNIENPDLCAGCQVKILHCYADHIERLYVRARFATESAGQEIADLVKAPAFPIGQRIAEDSNADQGPL